MTGPEGEELAARYLESRGYTILERNWRCKAGELDIIAEQGDTRTIVEVKVRKGTVFGSPAEFVTHSKQQKIIRASAWYQQEKNYWGAIRFDVIAIEAAQGQEPQLEHIESAFVVATQ